MKKKKKLTIDEYMNIGKNDIFVYIIITIILFLILLYIGYKSNFYYILLFDLIMIIRIIERINTYHTLKQMKSYLTKNNLLDKIGNIDYWNERYYFLTDNYMIIKQNKEIFSFKYSQIKRIFKERKLKLSKPSNYKEYLHIITNDNEFKILTNSTILVGEDYKDISDYFIKKNTIIKDDKNVNNTKINEFIKKDSD